MITIILDKDTYFFCICMYVCVYIRIYGGVYISYPYTAYAYLPVKLTTPTPVAYSLMHSNILFFFFLTIQTFFMEKKVLNNTELPSILI